MRFNRLINAASFGAIGIMIMIQRDIEGPLISGYNGLAATCLFALIMAIVQLIKGLNELDEEYDEVEITPPTIYSRVNEDYYPHTRNWK